MFKGNHKNRNSFARQGSIIRQAKSGPAKPKRSSIVSAAPERCGNPFNQALKNRLSLRGRKLEAFKTEEHPWRGDTG
jgi:hypothetical protein